MVIDVALIVECMLGHRYDGVLGGALPELEMAERVVWALFRGDCVLERRHRSRFVSQFLNGNIPIQQFLVVSRTSFGYLWNDERGFDS